MKTPLLLFVFTLGFLRLFAASGDQPVHPATISTGKYLGLTRPLRDIPALTAAEYTALEKKGLTRKLNKGLEFRTFPFTAFARPNGPDPIRQDVMGSRHGSKSPVLNFDGANSPYFPPDCNGTAGPNHFMQTINTVYSIYDKSGTLVAGPTALNQLFTGVPGANYNDGDPIILYDEQADRWVVTEFSISGGTDYILFAVSTTNDPTGTWHKYSFPVSSLPDYPKFSVWRDGYYMGDNNTSGNDIYVFERSKMLNGEPAQSVGFNNPWRPTSVDGFMCVPPIDNDGAFAPENAPGMFIAFNDDALGGGTDQLWLYELTVDWITPSSSTFQRIQQIDVEPFSSDFGNNWNNIDQKGVSQRVDAIPQVIMNVPQYRNFGAYETILCCHTVNVDGVRHAGIRWYELRKIAADWEVRQQSTYAPDSHSRWMGSIMLNGSGELGLAYSISSLDLNPGIRYCGQTSGAFAAGNNTLDIEEDTIIEGSYSQTGANRWGDYAQVSVDPTDDKTFWFTSQYIGPSNARKTRIASFKFNFAPMATTLPADTITSTGATLHGEVNPNGVATDFHFEYGLTPFSMANTTPAVPAGAGAASVPVSAVVSGLLPGTTYYYKVVAESTGGSASGAKLNFATAGAPFLTVTPPNQPVTNVAGNTAFQVNSNVTWNAQCDVSWCTVTPGGSGNGMITAQYDENFQVEGRTATITVSGTGATTQTVTVNQDGVAAVLTVTPPNRNVEAAAGQTSFDVISNTSWTAVSDMTWCTVTSGGSGNGLIEASYEENQTTVPRMCTLLLSAPGAGQVSVTVTQSGQAPFISVTPAIREVTSAAGSVEFAVTSNVIWTASSAAPWCTVTPSGNGSGTIVADYTANDSGDPRVATLTISGESVTPQSVLINQAKWGTGIGETRQAGFVIYPNPANRYFMIVPPEAFTHDFEVKIIDAFGKVLHKQQQTNGEALRVELPAVTTGPYFLSVSTFDAIYFFKLLITR